MSNSSKNGFTVNLCNTIELPDIKYINELCRDKNMDIEFGVGFAKAPPILEDLFYLFYKEREDSIDFKFEENTFSKETIAKILERPLNEGEDTYYNYTLKFLAGLNYAACPGFTPMDKALNVINFMSCLSEKNKPADQYDPTNKNKNSKKTLDPKDLEDMLKEMADGVPNEGAEGQKDKRGKELSKDVISCVRDFLYDLSPEIVNIFGKDKISDMPINPRIIKDLKVMSTLKEKVGLGTALETKLIVDNRAKKKRNKQMDSHTQIMKTSKTQMVLPNFDDKLAKKELMVKEKVLPQTRKQVITMLLDDSGSMGSIQKQSYVRAVLLRFLEGVMKGEAEVNFHFFEASRYGYKKVTNLKEAQDLYKLVSHKRPSGGGTYIGRCLQETIDEIANDATYHDPEIWVVNDGDDHLDPKTVDPKGVKINSVMLGCRNENLIELARISGGIFTVEDMYDRR